MSILFELTRYGFVLVAAGGLLYWIIVVTRTLRALRAIPAVQEGLEHDAKDEDGVEPPVCIVLPAHNEERVIDECLHSLRAQAYSSLSIVIVLDRCTDRTAEIVKRHAAEDDRIDIIENSTCPPDWAGKCHAAELGARHAMTSRPALRDGFLLFADADTQFVPDLVRASVGLAKGRKVDLLSLLSTLRAARWFEQVAQPIAAMNLVRLFPIDRLNRGEGRRAFANGQFMLFRTPVYDEIGGHASVRERLLEDIALAKRVRITGGAIGVYFSANALRCSMYESFDAFVSGWKRIFLEGCNRKVSRLRKNAIRVAYAGLMVPLAQAAAIAFAVHAITGGDILYPAAALLVVGVALVLQGMALIPAYQRAGSSRWGTLLFPLGSAIIAFIMWRAADDLCERRPVRWGGREYILEPR